MKISRKHTTPLKPDPTHLIINTAKILVMPLCKRYHGYFQFKYFNKVNAWINPVILSSYHRCFLKWCLAYIPVHPYALSF